jgi:polyferredoxin
MHPEIAKFGNFLGRHQKTIRGIQWVVILFYALLIIVPPFLPLPDDSSTLLNNITAFAQFMFWGVWWPFVLVSIVLFGRMWCGVLCPEGSLSEFANRYGRGRGIPKWMKWGGWPFVSFSITTIYGQLTSVYQYPKPVILVLGGSTVAAIIIGLIYGKSSRVWCKYLCPVTGVFAVLSKLSPYRFKPDKHQWREFKGTLQVVNCPTLLPLRTMTSNSECLMCGKCNNHREAIHLDWRSPNQEMVKFGKTDQTLWESIIIIFGLCGFAMSAFQWPNSFWLIHIREIVESWFLAHNIMWVFGTNPPWWLLTNYPEHNDVFTWIFGFELLIYIIVIGLLLGSISTILIALSVRVSGELNKQHFNYLSQSLIPLGACCVFIGLVANTINILEKYADMGFTWTTVARFTLLTLATIWSLYLAFRFIRKLTKSYLRRTISLLLMILTFAVIDYSWVLVLHVWTVKADKIPWNTLWVS